MGNCLEAVAVVENGGMIAEQNEDPGKQEDEGRRIKEK
jgi:hypothetical protein